MVAVIEGEEKWHPGEVAKAKNSQTKENPSAWGARVWEETEHKASCLEPKPELSWGALPTTTAWNKNVLPWLNPVAKET